MSAKKAKKGMGKATPTKVGVLRGGFELGGRALEWNAAQPAERKLLAYLQGLPFGKLVAIDELPAALGYTRGTLMNHVHRPGTIHKEYAEWIPKSMTGSGESGRVMVLGNAKTIAELRRKLGRV